MEIIEYYCIFALTTAICAWLGFYRPILKSAREAEIYNEFTLNPRLSNMVFIILSLIVAPLMFFAVIFPSVGRVFNESLESIVYDEELDEDPDLD